MLATLFDFPFEDRHLLTWWSDVTTADVTAGGPIDSDEKRSAELMNCYAYFKRLFDERKAQPPRNDLVSMLAHNPATANLPPMEFLGNIMLLIVGGNDTTRNSMSGGLLRDDAESLDEWEKLRDEPVAGAERGLRDHPLADPACRTCGAPRSPTSSSAARPSARATRW